MKKKPRNVLKELQTRLQQHGWNTSDELEIERRRLRAATEPIRITALEPAQRWFGAFHAASREGDRTYRVEIRALDALHNSCTCPDFMVNGLGTCKHIEATLAHLRRRGVAAFSAAAQQGSPRVEIFVAPGAARRIAVAWPVSCAAPVRALVSPYFSHDNVLLADPATAVPALQRALAVAPARVCGSVRIASAVAAVADYLRRRDERCSARASFLRDVQDGKRTVNLLKLPLYAYQKEGMLHLAFGQRALLADDMGLGKTVQAIAACELLRQLNKIERVLIVSPVSVKGEWEEQIARFTSLPTQHIAGARHTRLGIYRAPAFFFLANYEQVLRDAAEINRLLAPDVVILDEAQRIKNWQTRTADAVKSLRSPFAFVLTGTPLENKIEELYSIFQFIDPQVFGPLFRFNRDFYAFDDAGKPTGYKNLEELHRRTRPFILRRRKEDIADQLPARTVKNFMVAMAPEQRVRYDEYRDKVARLLALAKRRPLRKEDFDRLQQYLACMRMLCDTPHILDPTCTVCPKLAELVPVLDDALAQDGVKILVFSEWERMLQLVRGLLDKHTTGYAWHTGSVPQMKRREEIRRFKQDPDCRVFLSTDAGSTGLNLQAASVVLNLDLPWNPARLEQRIARAWRKHQTRHVHVINLVTDNSIEQRMIGMLAQKQRLADGVLDGASDWASIKMPSGHAAFIERLEGVMGACAPPPAAMPVAVAEAPAHVPSVPVAFRDALVARMPERVLLLEARWKADGTCALLAVVDSAAEQVQPMAARVLRELASASTPAPTLEVLDRATYETIQRLMAAGILAQNTTVARLETLHASPALDASEARARQQLLAAVRTKQGDAARQARMSGVLQAGGFAAEARAPLARALELMMGALMMMETGVAQDDVVPLHALETFAASRGTLPANATTVLARMRDAATAAPEHDEQLLQDATQVYDHAAQALSQAINDFGGENR